MSRVFVLQHERELGADVNEVKFIGVYSSKGEAEDAVERLRGQPGFRDHPDGFCIDGYDLNRDGWPEGFVEEKDADD